MQRRSKVYIALLHYPMRNRRGDQITTSITNLDLHDIARAARTYEVEGFFIVHPSPNQHELIQQILHYWQEGYGGKYNADRKNAFERVHLAQHLEEVLELLTQHQQGPIYTVATDASPQLHSISYRELRSRIFQENQSYLLLFGTGWGMSPELLERCDLILDPIRAVGDYNHLSVRSAVAIILDRLLNEDGI